jgi:hypothetical protein
MINHRTPGTSNKSWSGSSYGVTGAPLDTWSRGRSTAAFGDRLGILACYTPLAYSASVFTFIESSVFGG